MLCCVDLAEVHAHLLSRRWAVVPRALDEAACAALLGCAPEQWTAEESPPDSPVSFSSEATGSVVSAWPEPLTGLARTLAARLQAPEFTDATWNRYEPGVGHIGMHRDPPAVGGVIAVFTLEGSTTFRIEPDLVFEVSHGDLVLLAGNGWPSQEDTCLRHAADPPPGPRTILTLRHNLSGPGGDFFAVPGS
jgi:hypothetical protein